MDKVALEIVVISAHDLKGVSNFGRPMRTFANVWTDSSTQNSTRVDRHGGSYPTWNDKFQMSVDKHFLQRKGSSLAIQIYCKTMLGKKRVGSARMPYSDILEGYTSPDSIHVLSYRVRRPNGRPRGTVDLSVKFLEKIHSRVRTSRAQSAMKYPGFPSESKMHASTSSEGSNANNGYAIGIPVAQFAYARHQHPCSTATVMAPSHFPAQNSLYSETHDNNTSYGYQHQYHHYGRVSRFNL